MVVAALLRTNRHVQHPRRPTLADVLVCAMCGLLEHSKHDFVPVEKAALAHRETIEAALAAVTVPRAEVVAAIAAIKVIKGQLQGNKDAANKVIEAGFKKLMQAAREQKDALKQLVCLLEGTYSEKLAALEAQLSALEDVDSTSEVALALVAATLAAATPTELLARSSLLENGLGRARGCVGGMRGFHYDGAVGKAV